jgi:hypothetical protein
MVRLQMRQHFRSRATLPCLESLSDGLRRRLRLSSESMIIEFGLDGCVVFKVGATRTDFIL